VLKATRSPPKLHAIAAARLDLPPTRCVLNELPRSTITHVPEPVFAGRRVVATLDDKETVKALPNKIDGCHDSAPEYFGAYCRVFRFEQFAQGDGLFRLPGRVSSIS
jgi:hypothetical protein